MADPSPEGTVAPANQAPAPRDVVLLLVHGIGRQRPGSVVLEVGTALHEWFSASGRGELERSLLKPDSRGDSGPASVTLLLRGDDGAARRLTLIESLWADEFDPPGFFGVLQWVLGPGTWLVFQHLATLPVQRVQRWTRGAAPAADGYEVAAMAIGMICFMFVVIPMQLAGVLFALLWLVPIKAVRRPIEAIVLGLSDILGDSYLFAQNPIVRRAMADRVRRDFEALPHDRAAVAVLAHSQGAAVALDMLGQQVRATPLVTYGGGARKLFTLVDKDGAPTMPWVFRGLWLLSAITVIAAVAAARNVSNVLAGDLAPDYAAGLAFTCLLIVAVLGGVMAGLAMSARRDIDARLQPTVDGVLARRRWLDVFATHDPVPAGPLLARVDYQRVADTCWFQGPGTPDTLRIVNEISALFDHTGYWRNPDGFIDPVMRWLATSLEQPWLWPPGDQAKAPAEGDWQKRNTNRGRRARAAAWLRILLIAGAMTLAARTSGVWTGWLPDVSSAISALREQLPGVVVDALAGWPALVRVYGVVAFGIGVLAHAAIALAFDTLVPGAVGRALERRLTRRSRPPKGGRLGTVAAAVAFVTIYAMAGVALAQAIAAASYRPLVDVVSWLPFWLHSWLR